MRGCGSRCVTEQQRNDYLKRAFHRHAYLDFRPDPHADETMCKPVCAHIQFRVTEFPLAHQQRAFGRDGAPGPGAIYEVSGPFRGSRAFHETTQSA